MVGAPWLEPAYRNEASGAALRRAAHAADLALDNEVTTETLRNDAVVKLLSGKLDSAIAGLSKAAELEPSNAVVWSDLAVAHLQRSKMASDPYELVLALSAANRAVRSDPGLQAGRFNLALALERLSLRDPAKAEWQLVSQHETDRLWASEAQAHAEALARKVVVRDWHLDLAAVRKAVEHGRPGGIRALVAGSPQSFREHLEEKLLPAWAEAEHEYRKPDAVRELAVARAIAEALVAAGGDRMAADAIAQIDRVQASDTLQFRRLVAGFLAYSKGLDLAGQGRFSKALSHFQNARATLHRERSPFAHWADFQIAHCQFQSVDYRQARARLATLAHGPSSAPYKSLQGRSLRLVGLIDGIEGRYATAVVSLKAAEAAFRKVKEAPYAARVSALLASTLENMGQRKEAWRRLYPALVESATFAAPEIRFSVAGNASWIAQREGETEIALWFRDEAVRNLPVTERPEVVVGALRHRASLLVALGRGTEAARDLAQAREFLERIAEPPIRKIDEGDLLLVESELVGIVAPEQAIAHLDKAIQIFRDTSYHYRLSEALYQRALANKALGRNEAAEHDLVAAIAELEQQREMLDSEEHRISYFDRVKNTFDTMIALQIEQRNRPDQALYFSEQAKARVLWDWMVAKPKGVPDLPSLQPAAAQPSDPASLQRGIPAGTAVVEYAVLPQKTAAWILHSRGDLQWVSLKPGAAALEDLVQKLRRAVLEDRSAELAPLAEQAYDLLIEPIERYLAPGERLVLIPDGPLHALPFSVLRDPKTGRYLFQNRVLTVAPSIRVYVESRRRDGALARGSGNIILVVAAPEFDPGIDPTLLPLKAGETEASIAGIFPGRVLRGPEATRKAFLEAAPDFELVHFGGHSVVNVEHPLLSQMLFAKDPADPSRGVLYSGDVLRQSFPRTRLVVLASCGTALGRISRTEGVENLARPFLAAGVPTVVASLWSVEDQVTADFFVRFYRNLKQGFDVAGALQATQIESLDQGLSLRVWAAFETIGGGVDESP